MTKASGPNKSKRELSAEERFFDLVAELIARAHLKQTAKDRSGASAPAAGKTISKTRKAEKPAKNERPTDV